MNPNFVASVFAGILIYQFVKYLVVSFIRIHQHYRDLKRQKLEHVRNELPVFVTFVRIHHIPDLRYIVRDGDIELGIQFSSSSIGKITKLLSVDQVCEILDCEDPNVSMVDLIFNNNTDEMLVGVDPFDAGVRWND